MPFEADLRVFYRRPFGLPCARRRPGVGDVPFWGIPGAVDELALQGYAVSTDYGLRYPSADVDLDTGDRVLIDVETEGDGAEEEPVLTLGAAQGGTPYRVRAEPKRINDGAETQALLSSVSV